jgi:hypothetical protein
MGPPPPPGSKKTKRDLSFQLEIFQSVCFPSRVGGWVGGRKEEEEEDHFAPEDPAHLIADDKETPVYVEDGPARRFPSH